MQLEAARERVLARLDDNLAAAGSLGFRDGRLNRRGITAVEVPRAVLRDDDRTRHQPSLLRRRGQGKHGNEAGEREHDGRLHLRVRLGERRHVFRRYCNVRRTAIASMHSLLARFGGGGILPLPMLAANGPAARRSRFCVKDDPRHEVGRSAAGI